MRRYNRDQRRMPEAAQGHWAVCAIDGEEPMFYEVCDTREEAEQCRQDRIEFFIHSIEQGEHMRRGVVWTDQYRAYLQEEFNRRIVVVYQDANGRMEDIELIHEPLYGFSEDETDDETGCDGDCEHCGGSDYIDDDSDDDEDDDGGDYELTDEDIDSEYWIVCDVSADGPKLLKILHCKAAAEAYRERLIVATLAAFEEAATAKRIYVWTEEYRQYLLGEFERRYVVVSETDFRDDEIELVTDPIYGPQELRIGGTDPDGSTWTC